MQSGVGTGTVDLCSEEGATTLHDGGYRVYLTETCNSQFAPTSFEEFVLLGKELSFTVNVANVSCE
jgi:hypothetical protein